MLIITRQIGQQKNRKTQQDLNSILNNWKFGNQPLKSSQEFLNKFTPWINDRLKEKEELEKYLKSKKVKKLSEIKDTETNPELIKELNEVKRLKQLADDCIIKIAKKLNLTKNDPDYTYERIYKVFEERLEGWEKPKRK